MDLKYATNHPVSCTRDYEPRIKHKLNKKINRLNGRYWMMHQNNLNRLVVRSYHADKR